MTMTFCHGPGCTREADEDFCSEKCSVGWHRQFADTTTFVEQTVSPEAEGVEVALAAIDGGLGETPAVEPTEITWDQLRAEVERVGDSVFFTEAGERRYGAVEMVVSVNQPAIRRAYRRLVGAECGQPGWLGRLFDRMFGRTS